MSNKLALSVVIVTRNRSQALAECLASLAGQMRAPSEIVVIDNASTDGTAVVVKKWQKRMSWPVRRVVESRVGYPLVYNRGLREARSDWVVFIDDDCIAAPGWLAAFNEAILKSGQRVRAFVGQSQTQQPATVWALAVLFADQLWKRNAISATNKVADLETLDNKNIAYYRPFLQKNQITFNEKAVTEPGDGAAEDADLGMQLAKYGAAAEYVPGALVWHRDPRQLGWYARRLLSGARANFWYRRRWLSARKKLGLEGQVGRWQFRNFWPIFCAEQGLIGLRGVAVWIIVASSFSFLKFYNRWLSWRGGEK